MLQQQVLAAGDAMCVAAADTASFAAAVRGGVVINQTGQKPSNRAGRGEEFLGWVFPRDSGPSFCLGTVSRGIKTSPDSPGRDRKGQFKHGTV